MGHLLGYARVSTTDPQPHLQVDALQRAGCYQVFTETATLGKLVFHVFAALAEFERDLIRERTSAGLAASRARGRHSVMTAQELKIAEGRQEPRSFGRGANGPTSARG